LHFHFQSASIGFMFIPAVSLFAVTRSILSFPHT